MDSRNKNVRVIVKKRALEESLKKLICIILIALLCVSTLGCTDIKRAAREGFEAGLNAALNESNEDAENE